MIAPIINRDAIIEKAKIHIYNKVEDADWGNAHDAAAAALPSIADELLAPIEALHQPLMSGWVPRPCSCGLDYEDCQTAQAVAAIREAVRA